MLYTHSWAHQGVKTFKFERAALVLDFKRWPFFGHAAPDYGGNRTYDFGILVHIEKTRLSFEILCSLVSNRPDHLAHVGSTPKVVGSIPTVVRHIFQLARCGYKPRITPQTSSSPEHITLSD